MKTATDKADDLPRRESGHFTTMVVEAHAKVNLTLEVLGVRPDGYHDLRSVVAPIPLHDDVELSPAPDGEISAGEIAGVPAESNLVVRAARALAAAAGCRKGTRIRVTKRIPMGAGLGGGSADAAAVINGLNAMWNLNLPVERLCEIGAEVGSDVPALVLGGFVLMEGRGERVTRIAPGEVRERMEDLVLHVPPVFSSTAEVYREFREEDRGLCENDLQPAACRLHPEIAAAMDELRARGLSGVRMSGSGSAVFGFTPTH